jgi:hypothetical protein
MASQGFSKVNRGSTTGHYRETVSIKSGTYNDHKVFLISSVTSSLPFLSLPGFNVGQALFHVC